VDVDLKEGKLMDRRNVEAIGVRRTGWAALDRDPQRDTVEFTCPHCGAQGQKNARRERAQYHFTDGFLQDLQGEATHCRACNGSLRVVPVVMLHDQDETRRFEAVFGQIQPDIFTDRERIEQRAGLKDKRHAVFAGDFIRCNRFAID